MCHRLVWVKLDGKGSIDYGVSQSVLGTIALRQGRLDEGRTQLRAALAIHGKVLGEAHPDNAQILNLLGELEFLAGRADAARQALVRSMEISRASQLR
jgi:Flp pilus assembly protein TadD